MNCLIIGYQNDSLIMFKSPIILNEPLDYCFCLSEGLA